jgi:hypothetical protein
MKFILIYISCPLYQASHRFLHVFVPEFESFVLQLITKVPEPVHTSTYTSLQDLIIDMAYPRSYFPCLLACLPSVLAVAELPSQTQVSQAMPTSTISSLWSKEEIFSFIGILIALSSLIITIGLISPTIRQWLCWPFKRKPKTSGICATLKHIKIA